MAVQRKTFGRPVSIDELKALCEEIAALVRAGVPLETGLSAIARELPSRLGSVARSLDERLQRGEDLPAALRSMPQKFPDYFVSLVEAGVRSGRLGVALEGIVAAGRQANELRRSIILALMYPVAMFFIAYVLFVLIVSRSAARLGAFYDASGVPRRLLTEAVVAFGQLAWYWHAIILVVVTLAIVGWLYVSSRARLMQSENGGWALGWLRAARRVLLCSRYCTFTDILALLFQQHVPAPAAVRLAAQASGSRQLCRAAEEMAGALEQGATRAKIEGLPPRVRWLIAAVAPGGASMEDVVRGLRRCSDSYQETLQRDADWLRVYVPLFATVVIGGGMTLAYVLALLWPLWQLLHQLGQFPVHMI